MHLNIGPFVITFGVGVGTPGVGLMEGVIVIVGLGVDVGVRVGVLVGVGDAGIGLAVGLGMLVGDGLFVGELVGVIVGTTVGVGLGETIVLEFLGLEVSRASKSRLLLSVSFPWPFVSSSCL